MTATRIVWSVLACLLLSSSAACEQLRSRTQRNSPRTADTNTNWLVCETSADCRSGEQCIARRCMPTCEGEASTCEAASDGNVTPNVQRISSVAIEPPADAAVAPSLAEPDGSTVSEECSWPVQDDDPTTPCAVPVRLAAGEDFACAVDDAGHVACWGGDNASGQTTVPETLGTIVQLAAGGSHACALDDRGQITCWGSNDLGQATVPASAATVVQIAAGLLHTCALDDQDCVFRSTRTSVPADPDRSERSDGFDRSERSDGGGQFWFLSSGG